MARRPLCAVVWALIVATAHVGGAQSARDRAAGAAKDEVSARIQQALSEGGPYSKELIDPLTTLSRVYREEGQDAQADAVIEQALQVMRANYGLRSLEQAPLIRQRILSEESRGNFAAAWELEQALQTMARAHPEDLRAAAVFEEIGDNRIDVLERYRGGETPPQVVLGCYYDERQFRPPEWGDENRNCTSGSKQLAERAIVIDAQRNYARAISVLLRQRRYADEELLELEQNLVRSSYVYGGRYVTGRQSLARMLSYSVANGEPLLSRATALMHIADWDLLFDQRSLAIDAYEQMYEFLKQQGTPQVAIDALFAPAIPVVLPTFLPSPLVQADTFATGYIDVAFEITRFGTSRKIDVLGSTPNVPVAAKDSLVHLVARSRFRPRVTDGTVKSSRVVVRSPVPEQMSDYSP